MNKDDIHEHQDRQDRQENAQQAPVQVGINALTTNTASPPVNMGLGGRVLLIDRAEQPAPAARAALEMGFYFATPDECLASTVSDKPWSPMIMLEQMNAMNEGDKRLHEAMKLEKIMEQAQVFASAWSLVGGRFDNGNMLDEAEAAEKELRQMVAEALAEQPAPVQGWKLVPYALTPEMSHIVETEMEGRDFADFWRDLLNAAPQPQGDAQ